MALLGEEVIQSALAGSEWRSQGSEIVAEWQLEDFAAALAFVDAVGALAEQTNHHPDILLHSWNKVQITLSTHSEGGVTSKDIDLARAIDAAAPSQ